MSTIGHLKNATKELGDMALYYIGDVAVIVVGAGENRLNTSFLKRINQLLDDVESNSACKGLITTGKGKFYGNGIDLAWLAGPRTSDEPMEFYNLLSNFIMRILLFPLPTVAALNGHAFAGGALVAFAHDIRVQQKERGWLCLNEVWIERMFAKFHFHMLKTKIGGGQAYTDAVVLGKRFTAEEALTAGIVHAITSEASLLSESCHLVKSFYGKKGYPRESLQDMKTAVFKDVVEEYEKLGQIMKQTNGSDISDATKIYSKL